jgi:hypothetical protein
MSSLAPDAPFVPESDHLIRARMMSGSMFPLVPEGTQLVFQRNEAYHPGDLVVFHHERGWICHRVVAVEGGQVTTWGDWSRQEDQPHLASALEGKCLFLVRKGVVIDLDWPVMRWGNRAAALLLPFLKRLLLHRP